MTLLTYDCPHCGLCDWLHETQPCPTCGTVLVLRPKGDPQPDCDLDREPGEPFDFRVVASDRTSWCEEDWTFIEFASRDPSVPALAFIGVLAPLEGGRWLLTFRSSAYRMMSGTDWFQVTELDTVSRT